MADRFFQGHGEDCRFRQSRMLPSSVDRSTVCCRSVCLLYIVTSASEDEVETWTRAKRKEGVRGSDVIQGKNWGVREVGERFSCREHVGIRLCQSRMSCQCLSYSLGNEWRYEGALSSETGCLASSYQGPKVPRAKGLPHRRRTRQAGTMPTCRRARKNADEENAREDSENQNLLAYVTALESEKWVS